jgi:zinc transporter 9
METIVYSQLENGNVPTQKIALSLLAGFTFMLIIEQLVSPHSHPHSYTLHTTTQSERRSDKQASLDFDAELGELERGPEVGTSSHSRNNSGQTTTQESSVTPEMQYRAYPLTMGLVMHALADGLALGSSILSDPGSSELSFIVFLALIIVSVCSLGHF